MPSMRSISIVFIAMALAAPLAQPSTGCTVAGADLPAALATAQASAARCLDIPAGTYSVTPGTLLVDADGLVITGAGMGRTVLQTPDGYAVTTRMFVLRLNGAHQSVSGLTIQGGASMTGTQALLGISIDTGASFAHVQRVEITGMYGGNTAGGSGIDLYRLWSTQGSAQHAVIEDCIIRDMPHATGIIINSSNNTIRNNTIRDVGNTFNRHGIYVQGGYNLIDGNTIERVGGYSLHAWQKVQAIDGSGNVYRANLSVDPGFQHMIVSGLPSNGANPAIPSGLPLTRFVTITGNTFRNTGGRAAAGINTDVPAIIEGNTFEDVVKSGAAVIQSNPTALGTIIRGNAVRAFQPSSTNGTAISPGAALVEGNTIDLRGLNGAIGTQAPGAIIGANMIYRGQ